MSTTPLVSPFKHLYFSLIVLVVFICVIATTTTNQSSANAIHNKFTNRLSQHLSRQKTLARTTTVNQVNHEETNHIWLLLNDDCRSTNEQWIQQQVLPILMMKSSSSSPSSVHSSTATTTTSDTNNKKKSEMNRIRTRSRFLNALSIRDVTANEMEQLSQLSCVKQVDIVTRFIKPNNPSTTTTTTPTTPTPTTTTTTDNSNNHHNNHKNNIQQQQQQQQQQHRRMKSAQSLELNYGPSQDQLNQMNVIGLHERGINGSGINILILDSGFRVTHNAFKHMNIRASYDFVNNDPIVDNESSDYPSQFHHGTQCLALIGGLDPTKFYGAAFGANFLLAKTEDVTTETSLEEDNFVRAIEWGEQLGASILSASLGYADPMYVDASDFDGKTSIVSRALNAAIDRGITCVIAMGNDGPRRLTLSVPADSFSSISVGAVDAGGNIAYFSSRGPSYDMRVKPEVCALGYNTLVVDPTSTYAYKRGSGTSFATPLVAGAVALLKQLHPHWTPGQMREALMQTADNALTPNNDYGWGVVNIEKAMDYKPGPCSGNGYENTNTTTNATDTTNGTCSCVSNYFGSQCQYFRSQCDTSCANGLCVNQKCECYSGWSGLYCDSSALASHGVSLTRSLFLVVSTLLVTLFLTA